MERGVLLSVLPPYLNRYTVVKHNQDVYDIVKEVLSAHKAFASDYDLIAPYFDGFTQLETIKRLFSFLKINVPYQVEPERSQTTKSPSALLTQAIGDCKHYAGFIAGVLDALNRRGAGFKFSYRFASYSLFDKTPGHVFIVVWIDGKEYWIDPVLKSFNERLEPSYILDKPINKNEMLSRVSGIANSEYYIEQEIPEGILEDVVTDDDVNADPELIPAIQLLLQYMVLNDEGQINDELLASYAGTLDNDIYTELVNARVLINQKAIGGFFGDLFHGVKAVAGAAPRNAYLGLVAINAFGLASKLAKCYYKPDGKTIDWINYKKISDKWTSLGGKRENLRAAADAGKNKPKILGVVPAAIPAWVVTAGAIIAALTPILTAILNSKRTEDYSQSGITDYGINANDYPPTGGGDIMDFVKENPMIIAGAGIAIFYFMSKNKK